MSTEESKAAASAEQVEEQLRAAIAEAASNVEAMGEAAPTDPAAQAELAASAANVATQWCNVAVGMIAGLERFRLAHDKVAGGVKEPAGVPVGGTGDRVVQLLAEVKAEADNGASPTRIGAMIEASGLLGLEA